MILQKNNVYTSAICRCVLQFLSLISVFLLILSKCFSADILSVIMKNDMLGPVLSDCKKKSIRRFVIMENGKIYAISVSEERGTQKKNVHSARLIEDWGIEHDAHAGK